jgi:hypothetical protein
LLLSGLIKQADARGPFGCEAKAFHEPLGDHQVASSSDAEAQRIVVAGAGIVGRQAERLDEPLRELEVAVSVALAQRIIVIGAGVVRRQAEDIRAGSNEKLFRSIYRGHLDIALWLAERFKQMGAHDAP